MFFSFFGYCLSGSSPLGFSCFFLFVVGGAQVAPLVWASKQLETG
jgi:hypothetical protein